MIVDSEVTKDLKGREVPMGAIPGVGTIMFIAGNRYRLVYRRENPVRLSFELEKRYEPAV